MTSPKDQPQPGSALTSDGKGLKRGDWITHPVFGTSCVDNEYPDPFAKLDGFTFLGRPDPETDDGSWMPHVDGQDTVVIVERKVFDGKLFWRPASQPNAGESAPVTPERDEVAGAVEALSRGCQGWTVEAAQKASAIHYVSTANLLVLLTDHARQASLLEATRRAQRDELARIEEIVIENLRCRGMRSHGTPAIQDVFDALDEWKSIADREFAARTAAREEATKNRHLLGELLAIIHRDGGHAVEEHGLEKASKLASQSVIALTSRIAELEAERAKDREALQELTDMFALEDECSIGRFDRLAEMFRRDTGFMAPGKDRGVGSVDQPDGDELRAIYDAWFVAKVTRARARLSASSTEEGA